MSDDQTKMTKFRAYPDGGAPEDYEPVEAETASGAASRFLCDLVMTGNARANETMFIVVEHERGPEVDPWATWHTDEDGTFAVFDAKVSRVYAEVTESRREPEPRSDPCRSHAHELATVDDFFAALGGNGQFPDDIADRVRAFDRAALRAYISACSEEYDCSGWGFGFPESLYNQMVGVSFMTVPLERLQVLRELYRRAVGWWNTEQKFVETAEWERRMA